MKPPVKIYASGQTDKDRKRNLKTEAAVIDQIFCQPAGFSFHEMRQLWLSTSHSDYEGKASNTGSASSQCKIIFTNHFFRPMAAANLPVVPSLLNEKK